MTHKTPGKKRARGLQDVTRDELGGRPAYTTCLQLVEKHVALRGSCASEEEFLCRVFELEKATLAHSAGVKLKEGEAP